MLDILIKYISLSALIIILPVMMIPNLNPNYKDFFKYKNDEFSFTKDGHSLDKKFSNLPQELVILQETIKKNWNPPPTKIKRELKFEVGLGTRVSEETHLNESNNTDEIRLFQTARRAIDLTSTDDLCSEDLALSGTARSSYGHVKFNDGFSGYNITMRYDGTTGEKTVYIDKIIFWAINKFILLRFLTLISVAVAAFGMIYLCYAQSVKSLVSELFEQMKTDNEKIIKICKLSPITLFPLFYIAGLLTLLEALKLDNSSQNFDINTELLIFSGIIITTAIIALALFCNKILILTNKRVIKAGIITLSYEQSKLDTIKRVDIQEAMTLLGIIGKLDVIQYIESHSLKFSSIFKPSTIRNAIEQQKKLYEADDAELGTDQDEETDYDMPVPIYTYSEEEIEESLAVKYCAYCANEVPVKTTSCPLCGKIFK